MEKRMTLTKEKNNTHKQRTLPNDERPFNGSNGHEMDINGCQKMAFVPHTYIGLNHGLYKRKCGTRAPGGKKILQCNIANIVWYLIPKHAKIILIF